MPIASRFRLHPWSNAARNIARRTLPSLLDWAVFPASVLLAYELRFGVAIPAGDLPLMKFSAGVWTLTGAAAILVARIHRGTWRYTSVYDAGRILAATLAGTLAGGTILLFVVRSPALPRSIYALEWLLSSSLALGGRLLSQLLLSVRRSKPRAGARTRVLIYGAGSAGIMLLREFRHNRSLMCDVVGFVDDDPLKAKLILGGKPILGVGEKLPLLVSQFAIDRVLIAIPSATGAEMTRILKLASDAKVEFKAVPGLGELIQDAELGRQIRDVAVEDLLGRHPVELDLGSIRGRIQGKAVMVTGAAGSIGSELCRQLARFEPASLVGFDAAETPLFHLQRAMAELAPDLHFCPEIGSVNDANTVRRVIAQHRPSVVYHAAAYKHVPLMEIHAFAAIETNVLGTWNVAHAAARGGVADFVMISTDKAVRPTSMMGATKRLAELLIRSLQQPQGTRFVAVRFGNVLGSNGSVVPIFKEQIAAGGPVTVTHPDITRYFMTIPEAVQLVLQAHALGRGGEVFVLEMGAPVKIADLATNLILLSGLQPGKDIEIRYTGLRAGEKLHEELHLIQECLLPTSHPKIRIYDSNHEIDETQMAKIVSQLRGIVEDREVGQLLLLVKDLIPEYNPGSHLLKAALSSASAASGRSMDRLPGASNGSARQPVAANLGA